MKKVDVSIVICTHRRFDLLAAAVQSLVNQTASPDSYEVIVVDNDHQPNLEVQEIVSKASSKNAIKYLHESKLGLSHARNAGAKLATSDYIGYLDDDGKANPKYIEILLKVLHEHAPDICGGPYYPFYLDPKPVWFLDRYGSSSHGEKPRYLTSRAYLTGSNIVFRRGLLDELGWFDPNFGMKGKKLWYGEETMIMINAWKANPELRVYYDPEIFVHHLVPARKMSILGHMRMLYQMGNSQVYFWMTEEERKKARFNAPWTLVRIVLRLMVKSLADVLFRDQEKYPRWQNFVYEKTSGHFGVMGSQVRLIKGMLFSKYSESVQKPHGLIG